MFQQITILGPGLLGASIAMAAQERGLAKRVVAWSRRPESRAKCRQQDWCDAVLETPEEAVTGSDLVILCTPVQTIVPLIKQIRAALSATAIVSDVGSTKRVICRDAQSTLHGLSATFLGAHPMAGSELTGMEHAQANLFEHSACILTPVNDTPTKVITQVSAFWEALGMIVSSASPERHDEIVAHVSHLPHLLASTLCAYLARQDQNWGKLSGGGLRDTTRVASGDPQLWKQILEQNSNEVLSAIDGFEQALHQLKAALLNQDSAGVIKHLEQGKAYRDQLPTD